ncbi:hypothetical protein SteCoe_36890 [Stentor coeruleus]|uniref:PPM-type phosphatase domain-containing protein n=1 Tax=Stentor coeruleus TaxID=5963 RepID=A0A1R2AP93_9CILI|nr:hypothetical protein SteCoe_36890 [Stentor coeruleus]
MLFELVSILISGVISCKSQQDLGHITYAANLPNEDRYVVDSIKGFKLAGVFDGHGGWQVSEFLKKNLKQYLEDHIQTTENWAEALNQTFDSLENSLIELARGSYKLGFSSVATVGACATVALVTENKFFVANTGDCQAILVTNRTGEVKGINICQIHSANNKNEQIKLAKEHPGEDDVVKCRREKACYVKGRLMPTRTFGDFYLKSQEFNNPDKIPSEYGFKKQRIENFSGPYITHTPDIQVRDVHSDDKYLILATDGLWDDISEQEAAEIAFMAKSPQEAADLLLDEVLNHAAYERNLQRHELEALPFTSKRAYHDDITVVVIPLK